MRANLVEEYKKETKEIFNKRFGVIFNGEDNLKPLKIENLINSSPTATQCASIYASFLGGAGFEQDYSNIDLSEDFWEIVTPNDLLFDICESLSFHQGAFVHVQYNGNFEKIGFKVMPYTLCRLGKKDSKGFSGKIVVSPKGWGRSLKKEEITVFDTYNPDPNVIADQVSHSGGWKYYKGQICFFSLAKKYTYPKSLIEPAYLYADLENYLGMFYNSTVKKGFENVSFILHKKFANDAEHEDFIEQLKGMSGVENANKTLLCEVDTPGDIEDHIQFKTFPNESKAEKFAHFERSAANFIRKAFKSIPAQLVDFVPGKLGNTSADDVVMAQASYNSNIALHKTRVENLFTRLFSNFKEPIGVEGRANWKIKQFRLLEDGTIEGKAPGKQQSPIDNRQSAVKNGVLNL